MDACEIKQRCAPNALPIRCWRPPSWTFTPRENENRKIDREDIKGEEGMY